MSATAKQEAQRILDHLPEDATLEQIQYHLSVLQRIEEGQRAIAEGRVIPHEEVVRRMTSLRFIHGARDLARLSTRD